VARIREQANAGYIDEHEVMLREAADEIERLRKILAVIADAVESEHGELPGGSAYAIGRIRLALEEVRNVQ